jgi:hypothetical protein
MSDTHSSEHEHKKRRDVRGMINDVACCPRDHYCTLKEVLCHAPRQAREILQIKCVEKFKYERSERESRAIDWQEAFDLWITEGFAEAFAQAFYEGIGFVELYKTVSHHGTSRERI